MMVIFLTIVLFLLPALVTSFLPPPNSVNATIAYSGNACPKLPEGESVLVGLAGDGSGATMAFGDAATATIGPGIPRLQNHGKNCVVHFTIRHPSGIIFAVEEVFHNGYATLDPGVNATIHSTHVFSNIDTGYDSWQARLQGGSQSAAAGQTFSNHINIGEKGMVWSNCGGTSSFGFHLRIQLTSGDANANGSMTISKDSVGNQLVQGFKLRWKECRW